MARWQLKQAEAVVKDFKVILASDRRAAARILVLLRELADDPAALENLTTDDHTDYDRGFQVMPWRSIAARQALNIWRLKGLPDLPEGRVWRHWRLFYAPDYRVRRLPNDSNTQTIWILGIARREEDYDPNSNFARRLGDDYARLGLQTLPR